MGGDGEKEAFPSHFFLWTASLIPISISIHQQIMILHTSILIPNKGAQLAFIQSSTGDIWSNCTIMLLLFWK